MRCVPLLPAVVLSQLLLFTQPLMCFVSSALLSPLVLLLLLLLQDVLELLIEVAESYPKFLRKHLQELVSAMMQVGQ
jgi:hypothetical protein